MIDAVNMPLSINLTRRLYNLQEIASEMPQEINKLFSKKLHKFHSLGII